MFMKIIIHWPFILGLMVHYLLKSTEHFDGRKNGSHAQISLWPPINVASLDQWLLKEILTSDLCYCVAHLTKSKLEIPMDVDIVATHSIC